MIPELQGQFRGIAADNERVDNSINAADTSALLEGNSVNIQHVAGVIDHDDINRLKRLIFRSTKGKSYLFMRNYVDADEQDGHQKGNRSVYIIVFWDGNHIERRSRKSATHSPAIDMSSQFFQPFQAKLLRSKLLSVTPGQFIIKPEIS